MSLFPYILAGLRNKPGRNIATAFCFAFIAASIFSGQYLLAGAAGGIGQGISRMGADHLVVPVDYMALMGGRGPDNTIPIVRAEPSVFRFNRSIMDTIGRARGVSGMSPQLYVTTMYVPALAPTPIDVYGIDPDTDFTILPWLEHPPEHPLASGEVFVGHGIKGEVSSSINLNRHHYTIAGRLDPTQSGADTTVFLSLGDAYDLAATEGTLPASAPRILPGSVNAVLVRMGPEAEPDVVEADIRRLVPPSSAAVIGRHFSLDPVSRDIQDLSGVVSAISAIVVLAAFPLIALISAMVAHERQREIGLLSAMGGKRRVILFLVLSESLVLAAAGGIAGIGGGLLTIALLDAPGFLGNAVPVTFIMPSAMETLVLAGFAMSAVVLIAVVSSLYPAFRISRMSPYDAIRSGG
ncbi:MAG: ABC transporter permease [Methanoregulaceae archaeon]|nr:ABC transporter permease [Methanoregulaceae archaeon]